MIFCCLIVKCNDYNNCFLICLNPRWQVAIKFSLLLLLLYALNVDSIQFIDTFFSCLSSRFGAE